VWAALAWADGVLQESEGRAIEALIAASSLLGDQREVARQFLDHRVELATDEIAELSEAARESVYRAAVRMAMVDLEMAKEESDMLKKLRDELAIGDETARRIDRSVIE